MQTDAVYTCAGGRDLLVAAGTAVWNGAVKNALAIVRTTAVEN